MFGSWLKRAPEVATASQADPLHQAVRSELTGADDETIVVVTAMAGLLGAVAYGDHSYSSEEEARIRAELGRVRGMTAAGVDTICAVLRRHIVELSTVQAPRYTRVLVELADRELRLQVLELLVDLAAADGSVSLSETNLLRQLATSLGLDQSDYNQLQVKHRERLAVLRSPSGGSA
ncbi:MAG TPA: TerB family tellurite resistance protein [Polyangiaceae bacterium]|jgi:uncharacterized tellurite resistance protein B-like protein